MKGLGYRQLAGHLAGEYSYEEAVRRLKRDTRHFAKRQLTWFRKEPGITWLSIGESEPLEAVAARILDLVRRFLSDLAAQKEADELTSGQVSKTDGRLEAKQTTCQPANLPLGVAR